MTELREDSNRRRKANCKQGRHAQRLEAKGLASHEFQFAMLVLRRAREIHLSLSPHETQRTTTQTTQHNERGVTNFACLPRGSETST